VKTRLHIWAVLAVAALCAGGVAYAQRPATKPDRAPEPLPWHHRPVGPAFTL
jgi:hypothetical protein